MLTLIVVSILAIILLEERLPRIVERTLYTDFAKYVVGPAFLLDRRTLLLLVKKRNRTVLDTWLIVALWAYLFEILLSLTFIAATAWVFILFKVPEP